MTLVPPTSELTTPNRFLPFGTGKSPNRLGTTGKALTVYPPSLGPQNLGGVRSNKRLTVHAQTRLPLFLTHFPPLAARPDNVVVTPSVTLGPL